MSWHELNNVESDVKYQTIIIINYFWGIVGEWVDGGMSQRDSKKKCLNISSKKETLFLELIEVNT